MTGKIATMKRDKGFGFITPDDGSKDIFFHAQNVEGGIYDDLQEGEAVTFTVEEGPKGPAAAGVARA